jgi:hypothetical protein
VSDPNQSPELGLPEPTDPDDARLRTRGVLVLLLVVVVIVLAVGGIMIARSGDDVPAASAPAPAPCGTIITKPTDQTQQHITDEDVKYADAPPSFGAHYPQWEPFGRAFYTVDRPPVSHLVHNLEHGYTIAWYDETAAKNATTMKALRAVADDHLAKAERFLVVPWRSSDGAAFPAGMHVALTRWTADATDPSDLTKQRGNWLYCGGAEPDTFRAFFDQFPNSESPEPGIPVR